MRPTAIVVLFILAHATLPAQPYTGSITGTVVDAATQEPLPGVSVLVVGAPSTGTASGENGSFIIQRLPVGTYSLRISAVGYEVQILTNVVVATGRQTPARVKLVQTAIPSEEVTVRADYFGRGKALSPLSTNGFDRSEVRRLPGAIQDVQRVVQSLPGVASSTDNINELIVRGGAPFENLTVMDRMEIPSINHYSNQFNSAGPINMVNADMVDDVQFSAGGFPVQYGDKSSSVMTIAVREGNRGVDLSSSTGFTMAGMGTLLEGGLAGGRGSFILSARNSLLELLDRMLGLSSLGLTAVPRYWDTQGKVAFDLSPSNRLTWNFLYGDSRIAIEGDPKDEDELRRNVVDSSSVERAYPRNRQFATGLNLQTLMGRKGYGVATLYAFGSLQDVDVYSDFSRRVRGPEGEVLEYTPLSSRRVFTNTARESFIAAKYELAYQAADRHELSLGLQVQTALRWKNTVFVEGDTTRYDLNADGLFETGPVLVPVWRFDQGLHFAQASKYFLYASDRFRITPDLVLTFGLRYDHFTYSGSGNISPRASLSYELVPRRMTLTLAGGWYPQTHPLPYYSDRRQLDYNRGLRNMIATHIVLGLEQVLDDGLKVSLEAYTKRYRAVAVSESFVYSSIDTFWSDRYLTDGRRRSYGVELLVEKKQIRDFFGTLSVSLSKTEDADPRVPALTSWYPSDYDYPVIVTAVGGQVVRGIRDRLNELPAGLNYLAFLLPLSNEVEFSAKYRFQTGRPYTPKEYVSRQQFREGGVRWSPGSWVATERINAERYENYSRLDLQWISRFYFNSWNINVFIALQNVLDTRNVFYRDYRSDGTVETVYQFRFFPVGGVEVEF